MPRLKRESLEAVLAALLVNLSRVTVICNAGHFLAFQELSTEARRAMK
jgi:hypothetical protein